jgi:hypothetical protein
VELLGRDDPEHPVGVRAHPLDVLEPLQALIARGPHHLPRGRLLGVVLSGHRADHLRREAAASVLELDLLVVECEVQAGDLLSSGSLD